MNAEEISIIVQGLSEEESLPTLDQLIRQYGESDGVNIQTGIVVAAIQARIESEISA